MKRFMNSLLFAIVMLSLLWTGIANAQSGIFYNPERDGEGIFVTIEGDRIGFALFTFYNPDAPNEILPIVSPAPPEPNIVLPECIVEITETEGKEIPPVVSPRPPEGEEVDTTLYGGIPVWYIGQGVYKDGIALGDLYYQQAISYPYSFDGLVSDPVVVATFLLDGNGDGFDMYLDCNDLLPTSLYMCNNVMTFNTLILGE
jgi:hypothetical protein